MKTTKPSAAPSWASWGEYTRTLGIQVTIEQTGSYNNTDVVDRLTELVAKGWRVQKATDLGISLQGPDGKTFKTLQPFPIHDYGEWVRFREPPR